MDVLSILPYPVLPLTHGGRVRAYRLAVGLARAGARVDLCCPWHPGLPLRSFEREGIRIRPFVFASNILPALLGDRLVPPLLQLSIQPFTPGPRRLLRHASRFDVVEFHFCAYPSWMRRVRTATNVVYSAHNVELDYTLAHPRSRVWAAFGRRVGELERRAVQASDLVVTCTQADGKRLDQLYGRVNGIAVIPNGFDTQDVRTTDEPGRERVRAMLGFTPEELAILFVGGPAYHNRRAVQFLEHQLLPRLQRPARLLLAGQCAPPRHDGRVVSLGTVDSLSPLLAAADVAVNPMESGSGSNVKVAEYLAAGLPVVTTPVGLRGYEAFAHRVTVVELDGFPEALLGRHPRATDTSELQELSWEALGRRLHGIYRELVTRRKSERGR